MDELKNSSQNLSWKVKGSINRNKQRVKVARIHRKIRNQRKYFSHKISRIFRTCNLKYVT